MMNEEFERRWERKVEFLLNQQAKFDADMEEIKRTQAEESKKFAETREMIFSMASLTFEGFKITDARIKAVQKEAAEVQKAVGEAQKALAESQKLTDEKLRDLTALVDRHIREGHHGTAT